MNPLRILSAATLCLSLGACGAMNGVSRNGGPFETLPAATATPTAVTPAAATLPVAMEPQYDVAGIDISVPETLRVSEANVFYPFADIVWRGEPRGDRYEQVRAIFMDGFTKGTEGMANGPKVIVAAEVKRFHILTEKAKAFTGGTYAIKFILTVRDAKTGAVLDGPRLINATMPGVGGQKALDEEAHGLTERVQIVAHLAKVIRDELSVPVRGLPGDQVTSRATTTPGLLLPL